MNNIMRKALSGAFQLGGLRARRYAFDRRSGEGLNKSFSRVRSGMGLVASGRLAIAALLLFAGQVGADTTHNVTYYHASFNGSPIAATDENGSVLWRHAYSGFGFRKSDPATNGQAALNEIGFTGHVEEKGGVGQLIYMKRRFYLPSIGRFLSVDPAGFVEAEPQSFNPYVYALNNPNRYVDPDGRWAEDVLLGVPSLAVGLHSFGSNVLSGNWGSAAVDFGGIVADVAAIAAPGVPGGVGLGIKAGRVADAANAAGKASDAAGNGKTLYHYTDEAGAVGIEKAGAILPDAKGRVYVTEDKVSASEASNALFMGRGGKRGTHRVEIQPNQGIDLSSGTQPNELIHNGTIRNGRQGSLKVKENDF